MVVQWWWNEGGAVLGRRRRGAEKRRHAGGAGCSRRAPSAGPIGIGRLTASALPLLQRAEVVRVDVGNEHSGVIRTYGHGALSIGGAHAALARSEASEAASPSASPRLSARADASCSRAYWAGSMKASYSASWKNSSESGSKWSQEDQGSQGCGVISGSVRMVMTESRGWVGLGVESAAHDDTFGWKN